MIRPVNKISNKESMFTKMSVMDFGFFRRNLYKLWLQIKQKLVSLQFRILSQSSEILSKVDGWKTIKRGLWRWLQDFKLWYFILEMKCSVLGNVWINVVQDVLSKSLCFQCKKNFFRVSVARTNSSCSLF